MGISTPKPLVFCHEAMGTTFEIRIAGEESRYANDSAREAFSRLNQLDHCLNRYATESEITRIRNLPVGEELRLSRDTFDCLMLAMELSEYTEGAFDPALGSFMNLFSGSGSTPVCSRVKTGEPGVLELNPERKTVLHWGDPVDLDLNAMARGFALDCMGDVLRDRQIERAFLKAGSESMLAMEGPLESDGWNVRFNETHVLPLRYASIGSSTVLNPKNPVIDPQSGELASGAVRAWAIAPLAAWSDALSTAFVVMEWPKQLLLCHRFPDVGAVVLEKKEGRFHLHSSKRVTDLGFRPLG